MSDFKAKMHQIRFPDPTGELTALPGPLAGFKGSASRQEGEGNGMRKGRGEDGKGGKEEGRERDGEGRGKGDRGTAQDIGWDGEGKGKGKEREGRRGATAPILQFLAPPLNCAMLRCRVPMYECVASRIVSYS